MVHPPVFTRNTPKRLTVTAKRGVKFTTIDGHPEKCDCGTEKPMSFRGREGFISIEQRALKGLARGALGSTKEARVRWICKSCDSERTTYALKQIGSEQWPFANDHLWYPIRGAGEHTDMRKVLCLYRNLVESAFAIMKGIGVGGDESALWAQDLGIVHLIGIHLTLRTARRLAHENGTYALLAAEHAELGLGITDADPPSNRKMREARDKRPAHLQWSWPVPDRHGRLSD